MRNRMTPLLGFVISLLCLAAPAWADFKPSINVNCSRGQSLAAAVAFSLPNTVINITGTCPGPINITTNGIQLKGVLAAVINGGGKDAVTITGAQRVSLNGLSVTGGGSGVVAQNGAQVLLQNDTVSNNSLGDCRLG